MHPLPAVFPPGIPDGVAMPAAIRLFRKTVSRSPQPAALLWGKEGWLCANAAFSALLSLPSEKILRRSVALPASWNLLVDSLLSGSGNATVPVGDGWYRLSPTGVFGEDDRQEGLLLQLTPVGQDNADQRELNRLTRELDELLSLRNREWSALCETFQRTLHYQEQFASLASHDLQEPLRKIKSFSEVLRKQYVPATDTYAQNLFCRLQQAVQRMQQLLDDLSVFSELALQPDAFRQLALTEVVQEVLQEEVFRESQISLEPLPVIQADPVQIRQLFLQLISNAVKFTQAGEMPRVRISGRELTREERQHLPEHPARWVALHVEDDGIGFGEEDRERIFQLFQRLHGRDQFPGSGIGLAVCRRIVDLHGGRIEASSQPAKGSVFTVYLPSAD